MVQHMNVPAAEPWVIQQAGDWPRTVFCDLLDSSHYLQSAGRVHMNDRDRQYVVVMYKHDILLPIGVCIHVCI